MNKYGQILIVDDDPCMLRLLASSLASGYDVREAASGEEALQIAGSWRPDLVLLDLSLPGIDGYEVCGRLKASSGTIPPQVVVVSSRSSAEDLRRAFAVGADDYFVKPVRRCEITARVQLHMRLRKALSAAGDTNHELQPELLPLEATDNVNDVHATQEVAVFAMTKLAEARDNETGAHLNRLSVCSTRLAEEMRLSPDFADQIDNAFITDLRHSAPLHDIGKVGVPDRILLNPGRLTAAEFDVMKQHTVMGAEILQQASQLSQAGDFLRMAIGIARSHHERWDGEGYPDGLAGDDIPLAARVTSVVDVYDALTSQRPYKPAWDPNRARDYIVERGGTHFDPRITACFDLCFADIEALRRKLNDDSAEPPKELARLAVVAAC